MQRKPEIMLGFLLATVCWVGVLGWQASYAPTEGEKGQCEEAAKASGHKTEECKTLWERTTTDPVAFFTFWLVVFTGVLGASTVLLWLAGEKQLGLLKRSADISERALTELEAPFIAIKIVESGVDRTYGEMGHNFIKLIFCISNFGRTPARILEIVDKPIFVEKQEGLPRKILPDEATRNEMPWGVLAPPQSDSQPFENNLYAYTLREMVDDPLPLKTKNLFFYGFIRYADLFGNVFRTGYCYGFDVFSERWLLRGGEGYNYCQSEKSGFGSTTEPRAETANHLPKHLQDSFPRRLEEKLDKSLKEAGS